MAEGARRPQSPAERTRGEEIHQRLASLQQRIESSAERLRRPGSLDLHTLVELRDVAAEVLSLLDEHGPSDLTIQGEDGGDQ